MKKKFLSILVLLLFSLLLACDGGGSSEGGSGSNDDGGSAPPGGSDGGSTPSYDHDMGHKVAYSADGVSFNMVFVHGNITFPIGEGDVDTATVDNAFWIGETEVTYELWKKVYDWAVNGTGGADGEGQYTFAYQGREGDNGIVGNPSLNQEPVTSITWRDAIVFCNAITEWYNAVNNTNYTCVYYTDEKYESPLRISTDSSTSAHETDGSQDKPYIKASFNGNTEISNNIANGFRLLVNKEWELAARYRGTDVTCTVQKTINSIDFTNPSNGIFWTKHDVASGADARHNDNSAGGGDPGKAANDKVAVYGVYFIGSNFYDTGVNSTAVVKSKGLQGANKLGLYDMSGNVFEYCFDYYAGDIGEPHWRTMRGGAWNFNSFNLVTSAKLTIEPHLEGYFVGFRLGRSH